MDKRIIAARAAHVLVGPRPLAYGLLYGVDAMTGKPTAVPLRSDGSQGEALEATALPALCQWDDTRGLFFLDAKLNVNDSQTPMELEGKWAVSWRSVLHAVMSAWPLGSKSSIEAKLWGNFKNVVEIAGVDAAMFYMSAVSVDMVVASKSKKMSSSRLFEAMIRDYSLVDPRQHGLDAVDAATVKTYGQPRLADVSLSGDGRGDWRAWEPELRKMGLPSTAWLPWRRIRSRIREPQRELAGSILSILVPGLTDNVLRMPASGPGARDYWETVSKWSTGGSPADWRLRQKWLEELLSVGVWTAVSQGALWREAASRAGDGDEEARALADELAGSSVDRQFGFIASVWRGLHSKLDSLDDGRSEEEFEGLVMADDQLSTGLSMINLALAGPAVDAGDDENAAGPAPDAAAGVSHAGDDAKASDDGVQAGGKTSAASSGSKTRARKTGGSESDGTGVKHASTSLSKKAASGSSGRGAGSGEKPAVRKPIVHKSVPVEENGVIDYEMDVVTSDDLGE